MGKDSKRIYEIFTKEGLGIIDQEVYVRRGDENSKPVKIETLMGEPDEFQLLLNNLLEDGGYYLPDRYKTRIKVIFEKDE